ncbi:MAG: tRNA (adenosine(37)-N6)-threonylcarbamoyltransferase complex dimerization subunit type 1 TsaB [Chitinophagales bacterium]|jgi:tRNA threonylcarbamoyladenosine biosynthesis protein TsaB|nr:tRNA (adenosine(37)-N6)-threonylcarbamoyltransferase complex dimerization subunit type 1 TsaB [Sphingobacteriales bacterium]
MHILAIDTSTKCLSLSLIDISKENSIAHYIETEEENNHAKKINLSIQDILEKCEIKMENLSAIALNEGPGSFTGLRVGSSTAKGLCYSLDIPLINICGLGAYARFLYELRLNDYSDVFVLLDARRGNYFYSHFPFSNAEERANFGHISDIEAIIKRKQRPWIYYLDKDSEPPLSAKDLTLVIIEKWKQKVFVDIRNFEPQYIVNNYQTKK